LRVATINVLRTNPQREPLQRFIEREVPDVLVLQEFAPAWLDIFDRIDGRYPHRVRHEASQVQVLSRLPLANVAFHVVPGAWERVAVVSLDAGEGAEAFRLVALHGLLPVSPGRLGP